MAAFADVCPRSAEVLAGRHVLAYNADFDRRMLAQSCERYDLPVIRAEWECMLELYAAARTGFIETVASLDANWPKPANRSGLVMVSRPQVTIGVRSAAATWVLASVKCGKDGIVTVTGPMWLRIGCGLGLGPEALKRSGWFFFLDRRASGYCEKITVQQVHPFFCPFFKESNSRVEGWVFRLNLPKTSVKLY